MVKTVSLSGHEIKLMATASTLRRYRSKFGSDLVKDFKVLTEHASDIDGEALDVFYKLAYIMAEQGGTENMPDTLDEWLDTFDVFPLQDFLPIVVNLWSASMGMTVKAKKK